MDQQALLDELAKIGASKERLAVSQSRSGRRPIHVDTLLKKEKEGTLYKNTGDDHKIAMSQATLMAADQNASMYSGLPETTRKLIESHPMVKQHGMTPQAAMQVAGWSLKPGQSMGDFFAEQHLGGVRAPAAGAAPIASSTTNAVTKPISAAASSLASAPTIAASAPAAGSRALVRAPGAAIQARGARALGPATAAAGGLASRAGKVISAVRPALPGVAKGLGIGAALGGLAASAFSPHQDRQPVQQPVV